MLGADTAIGALRVRGTARNAIALRQRVGRQLQGAEFAPVELPESAILIIRRMNDPLPGVFGDPRQMLAPFSWQVSVRDTVQAFLNGAVRPVGGQISETADAVLFADEAELKAAILTAIVSGRAAQCWWMHRVHLTTGWTSGTYDAGDRHSLAPLLAAGPELIPAVFAVLATWRCAEDVTAGISDSGVKNLLQVIASALRVSKHVVGTDDCGDVANALVPESQGDDEQRRLAGAHDNERLTGVPPEPWQPWLIANCVGAGLDAHRRCLLGTALALHVAPSAVRGNPFVAKAAAYWRYRSAATGAAFESSTAAGEHRSGAVRRTNEFVEPLPDGEDSELPVAADSIRQDASVEPQRNPDLEPADSAVSNWQRVEATPRGGTGNPDRSRRSEIAGHDLNQTELTGPPALSPKSEPVASVSGEKNAPKQATFSGEQYRTQLGGVLYLIHVLEDLAVPVAFADDWPELAQANPWQVLSEVARCLLGNDTDEFSDDAIWAVLDRLAMQDPSSADTRSGDGHGWAKAIADAARRRLREALSPDRNRKDWLQRLLVFDATLYLTSSHVDLIVDINQIWLPVRRAGLDRNPGWLADYGRVVLFHFR